MCGAGWLRGTSGSAGARTASTRPCPPLEAKKVLFTKVARRYREWNRGSVEQFWKVMFVDVKKTHLESTCDEGHVYMCLHDEE